MTKGLKYTLYTVLALDIVGIFLAFIFADTLNCDGFEHLRMSWLVGQGYVPYRDFFEHHNPLLWYVFAPIIKFLPHDFMLILYVSKFFSLLVSCGKFYVIYLIFRDFFKDKKLFVYFFLTVAIFYPIWYGFSFFKPDNFEYFFYFLGLYYFFKYIENNNIKSLMLCGIYFTISFLFLQTVLFEILPLVIPAAWLMYEKKLTVKNLMIAIIPSLLIIGIFAGFLFYTDSWLEYFQLNWLFNRHVFGMSSVFVDKKSIMPMFSFHLLFGIISFIWIYKEKANNKYINIIAVLYICSIIQHLYFKAFFAHYLIQTFTLCAMLVAPVLKKISVDTKYKTASIYVVLFLIVSCCLNYVTLTYNNNLDRNKQMRIVNAPDVLCLTMVGNLYAIYNPKMSYYVMQTGISAVDNALYNRYPDYNINDVIAQYQPEYIDFENLQEKTDDRFVITPETLSKYVQVHPYLWQRKDTLSQ